MQHDARQQLKTTLKTIERQDEINGKTFRIPFITSMPRTGPDFEILCEILEPSVIGREMEQHGGKDYVSAIAYKINEYYGMRKKFRDQVKQQTLFQKGVGYRMIDYLDNTKLKIIDPNTEILRFGNRKKMEGFLKLPSIPNFLKEYIVNMSPEKDKEIYHTSFWNRLFTESVSKKKITMPQFISWNYNTQIQMMSSDMFLPPVPYIRNLKNTKDSLIIYMRDINQMSYGLYGQRSAFYINFDMELFRDGRAIEHISSIISEAPNKFIFIKMLGVSRFVSYGSGYYAKKNMEYFIKVLRDIKQMYPDKIIGLLDGGGLGYCLVGCCCDFFTDTVNNFYQDSFPRTKKGEERRYRSILHPISLTPEKEEGIMEQLNNHKAMFIDCDVARKYNGLDEHGFRNAVDKTEWSKDARKMGIIMWQKRMSALSNTDKMKLMNMRFDEITNSDFAVIGKMVKNAMNGS